MIKIRDTQIDVMKAIAIFLVVWGHIGGSFILLDDWFVVTSFHIPLFFFISGYLFDKNKVVDTKKHILKKVKKILLPCFLFHFIYGLIVTILKVGGYIEYGNALTMYDMFVGPLLNNTAYVFDVGAWFLPAFFIVEVIYLFLNGFRQKIKINDNIVLLLYLLVGFVGSYFMIKIENKSIFEFIAFRTMFFLFFYELGNYYKCKLAKIIEKTPHLIYFIILFLIQLILIQVFGIGQFPLVTNNSGFYTKIFYLPFLTSITGILLVLRIASIVSKSMQDKRLLEYISNNTISIMMHHFIYIYLFNWVLYVLKIPGIDSAVIRATRWVTFFNDKYQLKFIYILIAILGPLVGKYVYDRTKIYLKEKFMKKEIGLL